MHKKFYIVFREPSSRRWRRSLPNVNHGSGFDTREEAIERLNRMNIPETFEYALVEHLEPQRKTVIKFS